MRDLIACRITQTVDTFYQEICDVINFLAVNWFRCVCGHVCFDLDFSFFVLCVWCVLCV